MHGSWFFSGFVRLHRGYRGKCDSYSTMIFWPKRSKQLKLWYFDQIQTQSDDSFWSVCRSEGYVTVCPWRSKQWTKKELFFVICSSWLLMRGTVGQNDNKYSLDGSKYHSPSPTNSKCGDLHPVYRRYWHFFCFTTYYNDWIIE